MSSTKTLFIVGPIGENNSDVRKAADELRDHVIAPAAESVFGEDGFELTRADDIGEPGRITLQILQKLVESDVAVVDLANLNPNVMYELGIRQALRKPYVILRPSTQALPFDVRDFRAVDYELTLTGARDAVKNLASHLRAATSKERSPVDDLLFGVVATSEEGSSSAVERVIPQLLDELSTIRQTVDAVSGGVFFLMQKEDRERQEQQEFRQQEFGFRLLQTLTENPEGIEKAVDVVNRMNAMNQGVNPGQVILDQQEEPNRAQRRASGKGKQKGAQPLNDGS